MSEPRIFLSHAHPDSPFVRAVAAALRERGVEPLLGADSVAAGEPISGEVEEGLRSASVVVTFLGDTSDSPWLNFEIGAALGGSKTLLPVFLSRGGRHEVRPQLESLGGIEASDLKPDEVAAEIAEALAAAA